MSGFWDRVLRLPNGKDELRPLKDRFSDSARRVEESARKLARAAETASQQKKDDDFADLLRRFRASEGHD